MAIVSTTVADFTFGNGDESILKLDSRPGFYSGGLPLRLFPALPSSGSFVGEASSSPIVVASNGVITAGAVKGFDIAGEIVSFSGSDKASTEFPVESSFKYTSVGAEFDDEGGPVTVTLKVEGKKIKASKPFYGMFKVSYSTLYREYFWEYEDKGGSEINSLGDVFVFYRNAVASLSISREVVMEPEWVELYKVYSKYVADSGDSSVEADAADVGSWEFPPGFPDDNTYPGVGLEGPSVSGFQILKRVHMIGYVNVSGVTKEERFSHRTLQPYSLSFSYKPDLIVEYASAPSGNTHDDAFNTVNTDKIQSDVESLFPGYSITFPG